jgi:hypothetical protein
VADIHYSQLTKGNLKESVAADTEILLKRAAAVIYGE